MFDSRVKRYSALLAVITLFVAWWLVGAGGMQRIFPGQRPHRDVRTAELPPELELGVREAMFFVQLPGEAVQCTLCFRNCIISAGARGVCRVRENREGVLYTLVYGMPSAVNIEPIEKEPQYHHLPGSQILCIGTVGCNFICLHCHNWTLSQASPGDRQVFYLPPEKVVSTALDQNVPIISFTYNDPIVCFEYLFDVAVLARQNGIRVIWHSNGAINPEPLRKLLEYTDAVTIDLKGFTDEAYANSAARLQPVLDALKIIKEEGVWLEIVNLIIPTINDNPGDIRRMSRWIVDTLGPNVPLHFSRFFPNYRLTALPPTPIETLEKAHSIAKEEGIRFSTIGNVPGHIYNSTFCPECDYRLIHRVHFSVVYNKIQEGRCANCETEIPGLW